MTVIDIQTDPSRYRHWKLSIEDRVATLAMDVLEDGGIRPGYKLKLNSYDLGVDIELHDAVNRTIEYTSPEGKPYRLQEKTATLLVRPRGWHLSEKHVLIDGQHRRSVPKADHHHKPIFAGADV